MDISKHFKRTDVASFLGEREKLVSDFMAEREALEKKVKESLQKEEQILFSMPINDFWFFQTEEDREAFKNNKYVNFPRMLKEIVIYYNEGCQTGPFPYTSISMGFKSWCDTTGYHKQEPVVGIGMNFIDDKLQYGTHPRNTWYFLKKDDYEIVKEILTYLKGQLYPEKK